MQELQLKKVVFKKINSFLEVQQDTEININNSFSLEVNYAEKENICVATLKNKTYAQEDPENFKISLELQGLFQCGMISSDSEKQKAHIQIYQYLFPYAQMMIADLSVKAGLPMLMVEMPEMKEATVNVKSLK